VERKEEKMSQEPLEFRFTQIVTETDKAWLVELEDTGDNEWFPKSQCEIELDDENSFLHGAGTIYVPYWLAVEKELADGDGNPYW
jgi:hypothetical protein